MSSYVYSLRSYIVISFFWFKQIQSLLRPAYFTGDSLSLNFTFVSDMVNLLQVMPVFQWWDLISYLYPPILIYESNYFALKSLDLSVDDYYFAAVNNSMAYTLTILLWKLYLDQCNLITWTFSCKSSHNCSLSCSNLLIYVWISLVSINHSNNYVETSYL